MNKLASNFTYDPIDYATDIRLLELQPGTPTQEIRCSLKRVNLAQAGDFEALSYTWGDVTNLRTIACGSGKLNVTVSLDTALRHLRLEDKARTIWADAVCIDQKNIPERNAQVDRMRSIYEQAKQTIIWLGDDTAKLGDINTSLSGAFDLFPATALGSGDGAENNTAAEVAAATLELKRQGKPNLIDYDWTPLVSLLARPWFTRKWVIQEAAYAQQLLFVCGSTVIPFEAVGDLVKCLHQSGMAQGLESLFIRADPSYATVIRNFILIHQIRHVVKASLLGTPHGPTLSDMITVGQAFACSEQRDHVFAMIGLSTDCVDKNARANSAYFPKTDYGLSVNEVFTRATLWSLIDRQSLSVLSLSCKRDAGSTLPSWVPDLSTLEPISYISHDGSGFFQAGGSSKPVIDVVNQRILRLDGYIVDHVASLLPLADLPPIQADLLTKNKDSLPVDFLRWLRSCEAFATSSASGLTDAQFEAFWRTMTRDCDAIGERASSDVCKAFATYIRLVNGRLSNRITQEEKEALLECAPRVEQQLLRSGGQRFARTRQNRLGQVPRRAQIGDVICIFLGATTPHVVRPTGNGTYTLVGECYLHGMMYGEVLASKNVHKETIVLE